MCCALLIAKGGDEAIPIWSDKWPDTNCILNARPSGCINLSKYFPVLKEMNLTVEFTNDMVN